MKAYVDIHDKRWNKYKVDFEKVVCAAVECVHKDSEVSIILTNDSEIQQINREYRGIDKPTNVLSFELGDDVLLGDIYVSLDTVLREAKDANISVQNHVIHMIVHGVLHLQGYDHINDDDATVMENKEIKILKKLNIANPYSDDVVCAGGKYCPGAKTIAFLNRLKVRENSFWQYALYALFGGIASFGFAPFYQWWWMLVGVGGAYWLTIRNAKIGGFWRSLLRVAPFGAAYAVAMFWWVLHSIYVVPELTQQYAVWTIPGLLGLMLAGVCIFSWPFVAIARYKISGVGRVFMFATVWTLVLWAREWMFTGFPWNPIANIMIPVPVLSNSMSLWGALGAGFVIIGFVAGVVEVLRNYRKRALWGVVGFFILLACVGGYAGYNNIRYASFGVNVEHNTMIRIVQPATSQSQKATHSREQALRNAEDNLRRLVSLTRSGDDVADIVIFPETSYPFVVMHDDYIDLARIVGSPIVFGANTIHDGAVFNSMVVSSESGRIEHIYSKSHLVPFGEYRPLGILPAPVNLMPGDGPKIISVNGFVFAPAVCYEIIFSDSLLRAGAGHVDAIVNITNDNWFGNTPGIYQHLDMVRRYAIESGLPIVRANYSGISAFVASDGNVISSLPVGQSGYLDGYVWGAHETPYRMLGMNIWMIIILIVGCAGVFIGMRYKE
ncbi:MAG: apolipoprotein N-acyltransferase [Alphaproteobacteria bacterium]|nr:apolipoprotein N-acyltransferase [Alphaproteobacteria bacterium]